MLTFMCMLNIRNCYVDDVQGWGGDVMFDVNVMFRGGVGC